MEGYEAETYGERIADIYDHTVRPASEVGPTVDVLTNLAGPGRALELGIGTGRVAIPLKDRGVKVEGIDISPAMVARLRAKPGGNTFPVSIADFEDVAVEGRFELIYVLFNTFFALLTQDQQVRCFAKVAEHLISTGKFVIEAFVPDMTLFDRGQRVSAVDVGVQQVRLDVSRLDVASQRVDSAHIHLAETGLELYPVAIRYAWPTELDLMARLAGLQLQRRWSGWNGEPFNSDSKLHVSVYSP
jgi:SAM-dependent methyltransferase